MLAVIKTGGKQYVVRPGDKIKIEKVKTPVGNEVVFEDVILVLKDDKDVAIGMPYALEYRVIGKVLADVKGKKLIVYKYKAKKRYQRKRGHRQKYTEVEIVEISRNK